MKEVPKFETNEEETNTNKEEWIEGEEWGEKIYYYKNKRRNTIDDVAEKIVNYARVHGVKVVTVFNGIRLEATPYSTVGGILSRYWKGSLGKSVMLRHFPEEQSKARERVEKIKKMQERADNLLKELQGLNFNNPENVLNWLCEFQKVTDTIGVTIDIELVLFIFVERGGYYPKMNAHEVFNEEDPNSFARRIIGGAIDSLVRRSCIPPYIHELVKEWKDRFSKNTSSR